MRKALSVMSVMFLVVSFPAVALRGDAATTEYVTNAVLLEKAATQATHVLLEGMPARVAGPVQLMPVKQHEGAWIVENLLARELQEKGVAVSVLPAAQQVPDSSETGTPSDTLGGNPPLFLQKPTMSLEYRVVELSMDYPRTWRAHYIGRKMVERVALARLSARLIDRSSGSLVWVGQGSSTERDVVPVSRLAMLESKSQEWQHGSLPPGKLGGFVEPLVVATIVAGLVYLFYSNKE